MFCMISSNFVLKGERFLQKQLTTERGFKKYSLTCCEENRSKYTKKLKQKNCNSCFVKKILLIAIEKQIRKQLENKNQGKMAKRVNRQLKKQLEEQKNLEEELDKLQNGKDPKESCAEVIKFVQSTSMDPMPDTGKTEED
ncbi:hypothetical protein RFI_03450 [Reticulomyxa filosa]|uniref:Uncharacterized protein n=1 Tax=Reticulomyxa filosa TaxID=46433 RepID=X6P524_RETFI|nr:hypothetical protein RFI_03450 [Reticulomyxa filosa]|eukprot:ETO33650.1 hypothetical protein RFI_03450 [Reticulomyxa filosa]